MYQLNLVNLGYKEYVFRKDDKGEKFYIVLDGLVAIESPVSPSKNNGKKAIKIINFGSGGAFGELALITGTRRSTSVR